MSHQEHVLGIDIGTGSARAGIFTPDGVMLAEAKTPIAMHLARGMQCNPVRPRGCRCNVRFHHQYVGERHLLVGAP